MMLDWNQAVGVTRPSAVDTRIQMATGFHAKAIVEDRSNHAAFARIEDGRPLPLRGLAALATQLTRLLNRCCDSGSWQGRVNPPDEPVKLGQVIAQELFDRRVGYLPVFCNQAWFELDVRLDGIHLW